MLAKKSSSRFFDCQVQIGNNNVIRGACFSPPKRDHFLRISSTRSPVKIKCFSLNDNNNELLTYNQVQLTQLNEFNESERMDISPDQVQVISNLQSVALQQLVSIKAKVARADAVKNRKLMIQCLTSKTCTSLIKLAQQFLWKKYVNSCEPRQTYIFKNLRLRQKADCRRLNTPKEIEIKVSFDEAPPFEGELASKDQLPPVTEVSQIAVIIGYQCLFIQVLFHLHQKSKQEVRKKRILQ